MKTITDPVERSRVLAHLKHWCKKGEPSETGIAVAAMLDAWKGLHNLDDDDMAKSDWSHQRFVAVKIRHVSFSTYDFDYLTQLVFIAHDRCIRVDLMPGTKYMWVIFVPRERVGGMSDRHPALEEAVAKWRERNPAEQLVLAEAADV